MKFIFDTLGAERGFEVAAEAGVRFFSETGHTVCLVGQADQIKLFLNTRLPLNDKVIIVDARDSVCMWETPKEALSLKKGASINVAMAAWDPEEPTAVISPGHSGATVVAARSHLGLLPGISHTCLSQIIPLGHNSHVVISDVGASLNATSQDLLHYAIMNSALATTVLGIKKPLIGLLNIGTESNKGDQRLLEAHALMADRLPDFGGNVEGHHIWSHAVDIVITDGITGNVLLKSAEGLVSLFANLLMTQSGFDVENRNGESSAQFLKNRYGGAILLGVNGVCMICHGQATVDDMVSAAHLAARCINEKLVEAVRRQLGMVDLTVSESEEGDDL